MIKKLLLNFTYTKNNLQVLILIIVTSLTFNSVSYSQTTVINPAGDGGFENGATFAANGWTATTGTPTQNQWVCNTGATAGFSGTRAAYVTNNTATAPPPHTYTNNVTANTHIYRTITIPAGETDIQLNFDWIGVGEGGWANFDYLRVWKVPNNNAAANLPNYGTVLNNANANRIILAELNEQPTWTNLNITLPTNLAGTTFRLIFEWRNDGSDGGNPPIAIDNISLISDIPPPAPVNDNPCSATPLAVNTTCSFATYTNASATATTGVPAPVCGSYVGGDVWFTAVVPANGILIVDMNTGVMLDSGMAFYSGTCGALTLIECDDDDSLNGAMSSITTAGLTPGQTIFIRVWEYGNNNNGTFDICATTFSPCNTPTVTATTSIAISTATINWTAATPAPTGGYQYIVSPDNATNTPAGDITGNTGAGITTANVTGLAPNTTYYVFVRSNCGSGNFSAWDGPITFTTLVATVPTNDDPCNAIPLTVSSSCSFSTYTNEYATASTGVPAPGCGSYSGGDVWFTAVVPATGILIVDTDTGVIADSGIAFYSGTCGALTLIECDDDDSDNGAMSSITRTGLTPGQTIFIRVWEYGNDNNGTFDICAFTPTPPPNDDCSGAISLTSDTSCYTTLGTTDYASQSQAGCIGTADDDVWYSFVATGPEHTVTVTSGTIYDLVLQVFSGTCGSLTSLDCEDNNYPGAWDPDEETINLTGLIAGNVYFIRVYSWDSFSSDTGSFNICITEPCVTPPIDNTPNSCEMIIDEVGTDPFAITPYNPNPGFIIDCSITSIELATNAQMHETTSYDVVKIPYTYIASLGATINNAPIADDDLWADTPTALGFPFCFYDSSYSDCLIGANSILTFEYDANATSFTPTPGESSGYSFENNLPYVGTDLGTDDALFEQAIYGVYHDIDPRGLPANAITTRTQGVVGCRKFIAEWKDVPMYSDPTRLYSGMMVLYETTNIIEVYVEEKRIENGDSFPWNDGNAIVGIQGDITPLGPNNQYAVAPCRNGLDTNWEVTNEAWRFVPSGNSRLTGVEWYIGTDTSGTPDATTNTYTATTAGTYTAISTYATCDGSTVTLTDEVIITGGSKTWNGSVDDNWYIANNWTPTGVPNSSDCVVVPATAVSNGNAPIADIVNLIPLPPSPALARNLTLLPNSYLEVGTNTELIVQEWVTVQNTGILNLKSSSSLIQVDDSAVNTGNIHMQRSPNFDESAVLGTEYIYWSSPVASFQVTNISPSSSQLFGWTPTVGGNGAGNYGEWFNASGAMTDGTGYIVRGLGGTPPTIPATAYAISSNTALFSGVPNNGIINKPIFHGNYNGGPYAGVGNTATNEDDNWNLLGNPYPSAISANAFTNLNTNINGTVYVWPHNSTYSAATIDPFYEDYVYNYDGNDYIEHNNTGSNPPGTSDLFIGSGQAFFVMMNHGATSGSNITFNNGMRYDNTLNDLIINYDNSNFYRTNTTESNENTIERHRIWLDLLSPNNITNTILVGYVQNATNNFDRLFDGYDFSSGDNSGFYSVLENETLSIQGRSLPFLQEDTVPLGIIANETGSHTIAINTIDGLFSNEDQNIYIEDTALNIIHDIRLSPYSFTIEAGVHNDRFILRYTNEALGVNQLDDNDSISISAPKSEYIKVTSEIGIINSIAIYDIVGRVIFTTKDINQSEFILNETRLSDGTYIVKVQLSNGKQKIQKVVLKK
ncbi:T9SS type A sorting domain-containing protein [Psychroserpens luteus]|uniref:T9SS type A sorting domain-containing protein n=1 Tax=Psychroserpens luteus TaxID=1434066 RepID=A0ABW5ZV47_9FLAO|nr:T9SS type A sorting domain-containing protein [Psychroserpens luteus]